MLEIGKVYRRELGMVQMLDNTDCCIQLRSGDIVTVLDITKMDSPVGSYVRYEFLIENDVYYCFTGWFEETNQTQYWSLIC